VAIVRAQQMLLFRPSGPGRVGLIGCSAGKLDRRAPAAQLYTGPIFQLSCAWITGRTELGAWAILSAKHGVVLPGQEIDPYDVSLEAMSAAERRTWAGRTREQLIERWGRDVIYMVLAGAHYRAALEGLRFVEDVIESWARKRRDARLRPAHVSIGVLKKYLREQRGFGV
jgi:hypothetical protein